MIHCIEGIVANIGIGFTSGLILYILHRIHEKVMK